MNSLELKQSFIRTFKASIHKRFSPFLICILLKRLRQLQISIHQVSTILNFNIFQILSGQIYAN